MDYRKILQDSIDYIEANCKAETTAQELADVAGFSLFHYYRLFHLALGMPVAQYILRRRLLHAVYKIGCGSKIIDTALEYGFDTHAGFYKAFRREFGMSPSAFLKRHKVRKPYVPNLFQEGHIMITHRKIRSVLTHWGLENETISDIFYESSGNRNDNAYYVGDRYVIKFTENLGKLNKHIALSKSLENVGLRAAVPIATTDGREYVEDGALYFCLTERLRGSQMNSTDMYEGDYKGKARFVGEIIGQLHLALQRVEAVTGEQNIYETVRDWALPKATEVMKLQKSMCEEGMAALGKVYDKLPKQIIHRDPNPGNIILCQDKWGFIDFELSERGIRIFDPCYAATAILSENFTENDPQKLNKWIEIYKNILYGYNSVVTLTKEERKAAPYVILANQLICVAWLSEQEKYKDIFETNKKMTEWLIERLGELEVE